MRTKNIFKTLALTSLMFLSSGCSDWLAVDMEDGIMEDKLFESNEGFLATLNGAYSKMNEIYGTDLSMGVIDVMAQYYDIDQNSSHRFHSFANYNFKQNNVESTSSNLWTNLYNMIANLNTLIEHCDGSNSALKRQYYGYVKGEALALRAMFHFDLLRLYGPIYSAETAETETIPYQETTSKDIQPLLPASQVMEKVIRDLNEAAELLKEDKIRKDGVMNEGSEDPNESSDFRYRQYRLNYYAVQGLLARAYSWMQNNEKTLEIATAIIEENEKEKVFKWTPKANVQASQPDRLFSTEVMFALYNQKRNKVYDSMFNPSAGINQCLTFKGETTEEGDEGSKINTFYTDQDDLRKVSDMWSAEEIEQSDDFGSIKSQKSVCFNKYQKINVTGTHKFMIPLMRLSEIYLLAAECTNDLSKAIEYINAVRKNRNCVNLELQESDTKETIQKYITAEFAREVIGEGQLYFYYKRHAMTEIMSGSDFGEYWATGIFQMALQNYVWPLPKVEIDKRGTKK